MAHSPHTRFKPLAAFLLLCLLLAIGAMRDDLFPGSAARSLPPLPMEALTLAVLAVAAAFFAFLRGAVWPRRRQLAACIAIGLCLFAAPAILVQLTQSWISAFTRVTLFCLTPMFAVVLEPHIGTPLAAGRQAAGSLFAALAAVTGALCIFPFDLPASPQAAIALAAVVAAAACIAAANCFAVRLASAPAAVAPLAALAAFAASSALFLVAALRSPLSWHPAVAGPDLAWSAAITLPGLALFFWLLPRMTATRLTTRFLIAPLIAILFSIALNRPTLSLRVLAGLLLLATSAAWLLFAPTQQHDSLALNR